MSFPIPVRLLSPFTANSSRLRLREESERFARSLAPGALVLDAGAGDAPYRSLFADARYESADFCQVDKAYAPPTHVCDLAAIPVEDGRYDAVLFNQVMEHLPDPAAVLAELFRVLRPGGRLLYSGPLFFEEHEVPFDYYRYTRYGVTHLLEGAGFRIDRLDWLEGYFGTVAYQLNRMARYLPSRPASLGGGVGGWSVAAVLTAVRVLAAVGSLGFHRLELGVKYCDRGHPKNYVAEAVRPVV